MMRTGAIVAIMTLWFGCNAPESVSPTDLPWNITLQTDGSTQVFGLTPGKSTMRDGYTRFGEGLEGALFDTKGALSLEVYYSNVNLSGLTGKIILNLQASDATLKAIQAEAAEGKPTGLGSVRYEIPTIKAAAILDLPIRALTFAPGARLDEALVRQRFGEPTERIPGEKTLNLMYPKKGVGVLIRERGRDLIQYVHPSDMDWLRKHAINPVDAQ